MIGDWNNGTGRRKSSVARVFLKKGSGQIVVNGKDIEKFFGRQTSIMICKQPLMLTNHAQTFDIMVNVAGGGESGQAGAVRHGITRALIDYDATLKPEGPRALVCTSWCKGHAIERPGSGCVACAARFGRFWQCGRGRWQPRHLGRRQCRKPCRRGGLKRFQSLRREDPWAAPGGDVEFRAAAAAAATTATAPVSQATLE